MHRLFRMHVWMEEEEQRTCQAPHSLALALDFWEMSDAHEGYKGPEGGSEVRPATLRELR